MLTFVLTLHPQPRHLTIPQLAKALNEDRRRFERPDAVELAVRELVGVGLIQIDGGLVKPTAAAAVPHRDRERRLARTSGQFSGVGPAPLCWR